MGTIGKVIVQTMANKNLLTEVCYGLYDLEKNDIEKNILLNRLNKLENAIIDLEIFCEKLRYLTADETKYIHIRNYLKFYFSQSDSALIDTNIKLIKEYVLEKNKYSIYDILLEKMCLLNKFSIEILKDIKKLTKDEQGCYLWKDYLNLYNLPENLEFATILCSEEESEIYAKIAYGFKSLLEAGFITNHPELYLGPIDLVALDKFNLTSIGNILSKFID